MINPLRIPKILSQSQIDEYFSTGCLHIKNVYTVEAVDQIRSLLAKSLNDGTWSSAPHHNEGVTTDIFRTMPELVELIFTERYVQIFKDLLGPDMIILPEPAMHRNRFYYWHKDSTFLDEQAETFHWNKDFQAIMAAMYLQDNDDEYGGGLTVVPHTQHNRDPYHKIPKMNIAQSIYLKVQKMLGLSFFDTLEKDPKLTNIQSMKGDIVLIDIRLDHKGTTPKKRRENYDKFAYFNFVLDSDKYTADVIRCMRARPSGYFKEYLQHDKELPAILVEKSKELDFNIDF